MSEYFRKPISQKRVVVTGMGAITPLGNNVNDSWESALKGLSGIRQITKFDASAIDSHIAGEVKNFDPSTYIEKKEQKKMDLFIQYGMAASEMAIEDSGLELTEEITSKTGSFIGTGIGGLIGIENQHNVYNQKGPKRVSPFFIPMVIGNMASGQLSIKKKLLGPNFCITSACSSGAHSIGEAARYIRDGHCEIMVAGGTEACVCPMAISGFSSMKALSTRNDAPTIASRPFDKDRDGFVLAEGAGVLILEDYEHAVKRGAKIYCELTGYGASSDGHHMTSPAPDGSGAARSMNMALRDAGLNPENIDYINAHGTSTPVGDNLETLAIKKVFGDHARALAVSSTKSMTGHLLGAAGAVESVFSILALYNNVLPPTQNLENPSEDCDLDYVPITARDKKITHAMNNSFGFGGTNATLLFSKLEG